MPVRIERNGVALWRRYFAGGPRPSPINYCTTDSPWTSRKDHACLWSCLLMDGLPGHISSLFSPGPLVPGHVDMVTWLSFGHFRCVSLTLTNSFSTTSFYWMKMNRQCRRQNFPFEKRKGNTCSFLCPCGARSAECR